MWVQTILTQYTLAIDRQNSKLDEFYDPHHPAVLAMIKMAAENAHAGGAWIGICGELGADLELTEEFLKMGLDELSVSPAMVLAALENGSESVSKILQYIFEISSTDHIYYINIRTSRSAEKADRDVYFYPVQKRNDTCNNRTYVLLYT